MRTYEVADFAQFLGKLSAIGRGNTQLSPKNVCQWSNNPFHPSLRFKCVNHAEDVWSVRITRGYRALDIMEGDTVTWFWIGNHDDYEQFY